MGQKFFAIITNEKTGKNGQGVIEPKHISIIKLQRYLITRGITLDFTSLNKPQHIDAVGNTFEEGERQL